MNETRYNKISNFMTHPESLISNCIIYFPQSATNCYAIAA